jgi:hypothetical protein
MASHFSQRVFSFLKAPAVSQVAANLSEGMTSAVTEAEKL